MNEIIENWTDDHKNLVQFKGAFLRLYAGSPTTKMDTFARNAAGRFVIGDVQDAWELWNASREEMLK